MRVQHLRTSSCAALEQMSVMPSQGSPAEGQCLRHRPLYITEHKWLIPSSTVCRPWSLHHFLSDSQAVCVLKSVRCYHTELRVVFTSAVQRFSFACASMRASSCARDKLEHMAPDGHYCCHAVSRLGSLNGCGSTARIQGCGKDKTQSAAAGFKHNK